MALSSESSSGSNNTLEKRVESLNEKNRRLTKKVDDLTHRINMQKKFLSKGNLSTLQTLLDQYMDSSRTQLRRISAELVYSEFDSDDYVALHKFRNFLLQAHAQLGDFLVLPNAVVHGKLRNAQEKIAAIRDSINNLNGLPNEQLDLIIEEEDRLHEFILQMIEEWPS